MKSGSYGSSHDPHTHRRARSCRRAGCVGPNWHRTERNRFYTDLDLLCRGEPGDNPLHYKICATRAKVGRLLDRMGWCYGKREQISAEMRWHPCEKNSIRYR